MRNIKIENVKKNLRKFKIENVKKKMEKIQNEKNRENATRKKYKNSKLQKKIVKMHTMKYLLLAV